MFVPSFKKYGVTDHRVHRTPPPPPPLRGIRGIDGPVLSLKLGKYIWTGTLITRNRIIFLKVFYTFRRSLFIHSNILRLYPSFFPAWGDKPSWLNTPTWWWYLPSGFELLSFFSEMVIDHFMHLLLLGHNQYHIICLKFPKILGYQRYSCLCISIVVDSDWIVNQM